MHRFRVRTKKPKVSFPNGTAGGMDMVARYAESRAALVELLEAFEVEAAPDFIFALESWANVLADGRCAELVRELAHRLPEDECAGVALRRVLVGANGEPLRQAAERARVSHVALLKAQRRIGGRLLPRLPNRTGV